MINWNRRLHLKSMFWLFLDTDAQVHLKNDTRMHHRIFTHTLWCPSTQVGAAEFKSVNENSNLAKAWTKVICTYQNTPALGLGSKLIICLDFN